MNASASRLAIYAGILLPALLLALLPACGNKAPLSPSPTVSQSGWPDPSDPLIISPDTPPIIDLEPEEPFPVASPVVPDIDWAPNSGAPIGKIPYGKSYTDAGVVVMDVSASYPSSAGTAIGSYYAGVLEDAAYRCDKLSEEAKSLRRNGALKKVFSYSEDFTVELDNGGIISIRRDLSLDTVGELPDASVACDTFRAADGAMLALDDFFTVPQEEYVNRLLYSVRKFISSNGEGMFEDAPAAAVEIFPYDCFCVTQSGLSLFYPEQTIAPQNMGVVRIDIPWEVFGDIWKMP